MSVVAVQSLPVGFHPKFQQNRHSAPPPAALVTPAKRTPGIITLSKPLNTQRQSPKQRKASPSVPQSPPKSEKSRKPRSRATSDESEHETPSKPRGRRQNAEKQSEKDKSPASPASKRRNASRTRQTPSPESEPSPALQKPSGRLARQRKGFKSTPALCAALTTPASAPVPVPQLSNSAPHPSGLSRSAPLATSMPQSIPARMRRTTSNGREEKEVPPSPSPRRVRESSNGPLTAPLNGSFPRPTHHRSPSEILFNLSLDETDDEPHEMPVLFRNRGGDKAYAGGRFQNGPDTTTLPAPSFLSGF